MGGVRTIHGHDQPILQRLAAANKVPHDEGPGDCGERLEDFVVCGDGLGGGPIRCDLSTWEQGRDDARGAVEHDLLVDGVALAEHDVPADRTGDQGLDLVTSASTRERRGLAVVAAEGAKEDGGTLV